MIRVKKCSVAPASLSRTKRYDGEDVKEQLLEDHHEKCYICERRLVTDFEIEHFKSQDNHPELIQEWSNLFLVCSYCNGKKLSFYDDNVNPLSVNVEDEIEQRIDMRKNKAEFKSLVDDDQHNNTVRMLNGFYNGKGKLRKLKEERFFNEIKQKMIEFSRKINEYIMNPSPQQKASVVKELAIDKELLGMKYWMLYDYRIDADFNCETVWNKE